ncbi:methyltransferase domain-containing protein [Halomonas campisalis]|uniref:Methyltransferase domain-containing protein n=1 Tax=Billgrantia campisalis TaxID=74661 RepID=A0ABS9P8C6_9GAMM|nr:methyltransferase domain-containing protein [Halomonas campisalis]MCG6658026.1 methyltransferase domain-containing protein [Halomonas campisalis]MDR5862693.1 methyltransferase domain-containing protein [Halomonas campisalis]
MSESQQTELEALVNRLRDAAATLDAEQPPIAPPIGDWRRQLLALREGLSAPDPLLDPRRPELAELLAWDRDAEAFLATLYRYLLGREIDPEGRDYYLGILPELGRLQVAALLADSQESREHCRHQGVELPAGLRRVIAAANRAGRLDRRYLPVQRLLTRLLALVTRWRRRDWRHEASLARLLAQRATWEQERRELITAVLEMDDRQNQFGQRQDHEYARQRSLWEQLAVLRKRTASGATSPSALSTAPPTHPATAQSVASAPPESPLGAGMDEELDAYYLAFEAAFRGPEADIASHLDHYRDAWTRARQAGERALDLGCGRGEWLRLLQRAGFAPRGIDLNATMVAHCREQGFDVAHQDALAALRECEAGSQALISGFHIAEHLPFESLFQLVAEAYRALVPGGVLILETPNPENLIVASYSFYHDLTHRHPLTPPTLQFLLRFHGFGDTAIRRFNPPPEQTRVPGEGPVVERLNAMLAAPMDYAVVGTKPMAGEEERQP